MLEELGLSDFPGLVLRSIDSQIEEADVQLDSANFFFFVDIGTKAFWLS